MCIQICIKKITSTTSLGAIVMYKKLLVLSIIFISTPAFAGDADNISACVLKAKEFSGVVLDPFIVKYEGNIISRSTAQWDNAFCEVKVGSVYTLQVENQSYIYKGYAGKESYDLNANFQAKTDSAINQLKSRIALLQQRADQVSVSLHKPNPDKEWLARYINEGIQKSLGNSGELALTNSNQPSTAIQQKQNAATSTISSERTSTPLPKLPSVVASPTSYNEHLIPRSMPGDKGKYYLLEVQNVGGIVKALHKRVGVDAVGYTRTEINCQARQIREMGYSEISPEAIQEQPTNWHELVDGSSKSDLVNFVCNT
jgi:hypothetical protein